MELGHSRRPSGSGTQSDIGLPAGAGHRCGAGHPPDCSGAPSHLLRTDLAAWRQKVTELREVSGRLELFAAFADIEDAFEPFEELMTDLDVRIELEEQRESDQRRGK